MNIGQIRHFFGDTLRRRNLDNLLREHNYLFSEKSIVLDIGGRNRGTFNKPKNKVCKWVFADINKEHKPDVVLDVSAMNNVAEYSFNIIVATELFEHVRYPEKGLEECFRVLDNNGIMILSVPFLYRVHGDPFDFQRWTLEKWRSELGLAGFKIEKEIVMGRYFSVLGDQKKMLIGVFPKLIKYPLLLICTPIIYLFAQLDKTAFIKNHKILSSFHGGYFFVLKK